MSRFLFYISENYAFEILRPVQAEILSRGFQAAWFVEGNNVNKQLFDSTEQLLATVNDIVDFNPDAVLVPGNVVPDFIPGLKVQVFHGFEWKKKSHFRIRGMFDLYCTQGPLFTKKFEQLAERHRHFRVIETGWPKIDNLHTAAPYAWPEKDHRPVILYAPTFSPSLTSAPALYDQIKKLSSQGHWQWLIKFHPKMSPEWQDKYKRLCSDNLQVIEGQSVNNLLQCADVMISDTSSIITEFLLLNKPVVTFFNSQPEQHLLNFTDPENLTSLVEEALQAKNSNATLIAQVIKQLHPYQDGKSSERLVNATLQAIAESREGLRPKPLNLIRSLKLRKKLKHWRFW
jgi:hypothetical protein